MSRVSFWLGQLGAWGAFFLTANAGYNRVEDGGRVEPSPTCSFFFFFLGGVGGVGRLGGSVGQAFDFGSGHDLVIRGLEPRVGLWADGSEPGACFGFCVSLSLPLPDLHTFSLSLKNKNFFLKQGLHPKELLYHTKGFGLSSEGTRDSMTD